MSEIKNGPYTFQISLYMKICTPFAEPSCRSFHTKFSTIHFSLTLSHTSAFNHRVSSSAAFVSVDRALPSDVGLTGSHPPKFRWQNGEKWQAVQGYIPHLPLLLYLAKMWAWLIQKKISFSFFFVRFMQNPILIIENLPLDAPPHGIKFNSFCLKCFKKNRSSNSFCNISTLFFFGFLMLFVHLF